MTTKLYLAERPAYRIPGGKAMMLVDQHGDVIPNQVSCLLDQSADSIPTVTVKLAITGRGVTLGEPPCMGPVWMQRANAIAAAAIAEIIIMAEQAKSAIRPEATWLLSHGERVVIPPVGRSVRRT